MKAILTKYHGPGNVRGSRISATDSDGHRVSIKLESEWSMDEAHQIAARTLCAKMGWTGRLVSGGLGHNQVHVWVRPDGMPLAGSDFLVGVQS